MKRKNVVYCATPKRTDVPRNKGKEVDIKTVRTKMIETKTVETRTVKTRIGETEKVDTKTVETNTFETEISEDCGVKDKRRKSGKRKVKKRRRKLKRILIKLLKYVLFFSIVTLILTFIFEKIRFGQVIGKWFSAIMPLLFVAKFVIYGVDKLVIDCTGKSILEFIMDYEDSFIVEILKIFCQIFELAFDRILRCFGIKNFPKLKLRYGIMLSAVLVVASIGSENHFCVKAAEKCILFLQGNEGNNYIKFQNTQGVLGISTEHFKTTSEEKMNSDIEDINMNETIEVNSSLCLFTEEEIIDQFGEENYRQAQNIIMTEEDRNRVEELPQSHYNDIFHLEGEFKIEDWNDQEAIDAVILKEVKDEIGLKKENKFDKDDEDNLDVQNKLRTDVNTASEEEKTEHTFSDRIGFMGARTGAYGLYPKSSLALLASNDNQALALSLVLIGGKKQTEMYYYGESILWGWEYLGFADVSASSVKEKLNWIAERYKDIRFICSEGDPEYQYAEKLMTAYQHAANEF